MITDKMLTSFDWWLDYCGDKVEIVTGQVVVCKDCQMPMLWYPESQAWVCHGCNAIVGADDE